MTLEQRGPGLLVSGSPAIEEISIRVGHNPLVVLLESRSCNQLSVEQAGAVGELTCALADGQTETFPDAVEGARRGVRTGVGSVKLSAARRQFGFVALHARINVATPRMMVILP